MHTTLIETQAHQQISDRIARAREGRIPHTITGTTPGTTKRHRMAGSLRRFADRLDG